MVYKINNNNKTKRTKYKNNHTKTKADKIKKTTTTTQKTQI